MALGVVPARPSEVRPQAWLPDPARSAVSSAGHRLVVAARPGHDLVALELLLDAGGDTDPLTHAGLSALMLRAAREGTRQRSALEWANAVDEVGASVRSGVTLATGRVSIDLLRDQLPAALELVGEALSLPAFEPRAVERIRATMQAGAELAHGSPDRRAEHELRALAHRARTRLTLPLPGSPETLHDIGAGDVVAAHARAMARPVTVVAVGEVDIDLLGAVCDEVLPAPRTAEHRSPPEPSPTTAPRHVRLALPDLSQSHLALGAVLADRRDDDWPALRIAALAIAGSLHSRVDAVLRERLGITYGIRAHLSPRVGDGLFDISGGVQAGATAVAMAGLRGVLDDAASTGLTSAEVDSARGYLLGAAAIGLHTPRGYAEALADAVEAGQGGDGVADSLRRLRDVTLDEVNDVVSRSLRPELLCTVVVGPPGDVQPDELGSSPPVWS